MTHDSRSLPDRTRAPEAKSRVRREQRRLRRAFAALLASLSPVAITMQACTTSGPVNVSPGDDASAEADAQSDADAQGDADASAPPDGDAADEKSCQALVTAFDANADGEQNCVYTLPCGLPSYLNVANCEVYTNEDAALDCSLIETATCASDVNAPPAPPGATQIYCFDCFGGGRRPRGLARPRGVAARGVAGAYFARMAHDEAAAVHAFRRLAAELREHGAPAELIDAAERAARDEARHARLFASRARAEGTAIPPLRLRRSRPRSLAAIARENAAEGCVRETFGALLLRLQAASAPDPPLRLVLASVARDEARHAAIAWAIARWVEPLLGARDRARVERSRAIALRSLLRETASFERGSDIGLPTAAQRAALLAGLGCTIPDL
jgi:hypothetical protein